MTAEEGTISGALDITLDATCHGLVRYHETETWLTIGNLGNTEARTWESVDELAAAISSGAGARDAAGNIIPFEA